MLEKFTTVRGPVVAMTMASSGDVNVRLPVTSDTWKFQSLTEGTCDHVMLADAEDCGRTANTAANARETIKPFEIIRSYLNTGTFPPLLKIGRTFQT
ncbi:MAG: hypothetical protein RL470_1038 [Actinomycetota bacterium]